MKKQQKKPRAGSLLAKKEVGMKNKLPDAANHNSCETTSSLMYSSSRENGVFII
jgi:hypothetical protein